MFYLADSLMFLSFIDFRVLKLPATKPMVKNCCTVPQRGYVINNGKICQVGLSVSWMKPIVINEITATATKGNISFKTDLKLSVLNPQSFKTWLSFL